MERISGMEVAGVSETPEIQVLAQRLAKYGLGVCLPHMHGTDDAMVALAPGTVQYEEELRISFLDEADPTLAGATPVSWIWDDGMKVVGRCRQGHT